MEKEKIKAFIGNAKYDNFGQKIWAVDKDGGHQMLLDLRGWGAISNMFKDKSGQIDEDGAAKFQDDLGEFIAKAINNYVASTPPSVEKEEILERKRSAFYNKLQSLIREHWNNREITKVLRDLDDKFITGVF